MSIKNVGRRGEKWRAFPFAKMLGAPVGFQYPGGQSSFWPPGMKLDKTDPPRKHRSPWRGKWKLPLTDE